MAGNVDNRVVAMKFDNKDFEKNVSTTQATLRKLKDALQFKGSKQGLEEVSRAAGNVKGLDTMGDSVGKIEARFGALQVAAVTALATITTKAIDAGLKLGKALTLNNVIDGFKEYETNINSIQTILANTESKGATLETVNAALDELNQYADQTIYNFAQMTRNVGTFTAAGLGLDESVRSIKGIANLAAVSGSTSEQASTAMYQLSQALASGVVRAQDWISVVNAGMGGEIFQESLFETAKALGTLTDVPMDQTFEQWKEAGNNFKDSLQDQWITGEVLSTTLEGFTGELSDADLAARGYSEAQIQSIQALAKTATAAATDIKTATQLVDVIQEAIGSGWASTFRIVLGDFEEAKGLFSGMGTYITDIIGNITEARNFLLQGWKESGGRDAFFAGLLHSLDAVQQIVNPIRLAFRELFPRTTVQQLGELSQNFSEFAQKLKIGEGGMKKLYNVAKIFFGALRIGWEVVWGVTRVVAKLGSVLFSVASKIASFVLGFAGFEALGNVFSKAGSISAFFDAIVNGIDAAYGLLSAFAGFVGSKLSPVFDFIKDGFETAKDAVSDFVGGIADQFSGLDDTFNEVKGKVEDFVETVTNFFTGGGGGSSPIKRRRKGQRSGGGGGTWLDDIASYWGAGVDGANNAFTKAADIVKNAINSVRDAFGNLSSVGDGAEAALEGVKNFFISIGDAFGTAIDKIKEYASNFKQSIKDAFGSDTYDSILEGAQTGILGVVAAALGKIAFGGLDINFFSEFEDAIENLADTFKAMEQNIKANTIKQIAISIAILAASMIALSFLDGEQIKTSLIAMGVGLSGLLAGLFALGKIDGGLFKGPALAATLSLISLSLIAFAGAVLLFSLIPMDTFQDGMIKVGIAMAALTASAVALGKAGPGIFSGAAAMVVMSGALYALSFVIQRYTNIKWNDMIYGIGGIAGILTVLVLAMRAMPVQGMFTASIAMGVMAFSLGKMADVVETFAGLGWGELIRGLFGLSATLVVLVAVMFALGKLDVGKASLGMGVMAASLYVISLAIEKVASINLANMGVALLGLIGVLAALTIAAILVGKVGGPGVLGMIGLAGALWIIGQVLAELGKLSLAEIGKALLAIIGVIVVLGLAAAALGGTGPVGAVLAGGLVILAGSLLAIGAAFALMGAGAWLAVDALAKLKDVSDESIDKLIEIVTKFVKAVPNWAKEFAKGLGEFAIAILEMIPDINEALGEAISSIINLIIEKTPEVARLFGTIIDASIELMRSKLPLIGDFIIEMILVFGQKINDNIETIAALGGSILANFIAGLTTAIEDIGPEVLNFLVALGAFLVANIKALTDIAVDILVALIDAMADAVEDIGDALENLITKIGDAIIGVVGAITDAGVAILDEIIIGMANAAEDIGDDMETLIIAIKDTIIGVASTVADAGKEILLELLKGIEDNVTEVSDQLEDTVEAIADEIVDQIGVWGQAGIDILKALLEEGANRSSEAAMEFGKFLVAVAEGIEDAVAENTEPLFAAGKGIVKELINGMVAGLGLQSAVDTLKDGLKSLLDFLPWWAKELLGIESPSKVFMEIGKWIPAGLAEGIADDSAAQEATTGLVTKVTDTFAEGMSQAAFELENIDDPKITPVVDMTNVDAASAQVATAFGFAGAGNVQGPGRTLSSWTTAIQHGIDYARSRGIGAKYSDGDLAYKAQSFAPGKILAEDGSWVNPSFYGGSTRPSSVVFNQTINAPKQLSSAEIYRQTKGQITMAKEDLGIRT